jgi:acyl-CoA reductase-like NAD-dependent aldehyde dehydrogenase
MNQLLTGNGTPGAADTFDVVSPSTGDVVGSYREGTSDDVNRAVAVAADAATGWSDLPVRERSKLMWRFGEVIEAHHEELARIDAVSTGKALRDGLVEAQRAADDARFWAGQADKIFGAELADIRGRLTYTRHDPLGVYGVIIPWNAPTISFVNRCVPALSAGNTIVMKPSELAPANALRMAELAAEAGIPEGVIQVVTGSGATGDALVRHPGVGGVSFTGSAETGAKIAAAAAPTYKKVTLELGGKSPVVVFDDADLKSAALATLAGVAFNAGQICSAGTRLIVHESVQAKVLEIIRAAAPRIRVGDPLDPTTHVGPVSCRRQYDKVTGIIERSRVQATVYLGGGKPAHLADTPGLYIEPTVLTDVEPDAEVLTNEIFGPVLTVSTFRTVEEALELANNTRFGLSSYVWTRDMGRMFQMIEGIDAGVVHGNSPQVMNAAFPFAGRKASGFGTAYGLDAIEGFTQIKRVTVNVAPGPVAPLWSELVD